MNNNNNLPLISLHCHNCDFFWEQNLNQPLICNRCQSDIIEIVYTDNPVNGQPLPTPPPNNSNSRSTIRQPRTSRPHQNRTNVTTPSVPPPPPAPSMQTVPQATIQNNANSTPVVQQSNIRSVAQNQVNVPVLRYNIVPSEGSSSSISNVRYVFPVNNTLHLIQSSSSVSNTNRNTDQTNNSTNQLQNTLTSSTGSNDQNVNRGASSSRRRTRSRSPLRPERLDRNSDEPASKKICSRPMTNYEMRKIKRIYKGNLPKDEIECGICYEKYDSRKIIRQLQCQHVFHQVCIFAWLKKDSTCPFCRMNLIEDKQTG